MEFLQGLVSNPIVVGLLGVVGGVILAPISMLLYNHFKIGKLLSVNAEKAGNYIGLQVYKYALKKIKDKTLREKVTVDLDKAGDDFDKGFDEGIKGKSI